MCRFRLPALAVVALGACLGGCSSERFVDIHRYISAYRATHRADPPQRLARAPAKGPARSAAAAAGRAGEPVPLLTDLGRPAAADQAPSGKPTGRPEHWSTRRGPAYPDDWLRSFGRDAKELPATMWDDTRAAFTDPWTLISLAAAGAAGVAIHKGGADDSIEDHYKKTGSDLPKFWDNVGDVGGNPGLHFAVAGAMYFNSLYSGDKKAYETSKALLNALAINGLLTVGLKAAFHTESPNDEPWGWPSGHTSSTFCLATVMHEAYGPWAGVPLFLFAGYVGYERVDARNHDFSDVISGAIIGIAIGHAVMKNHEVKIFGFDVIPYADPATGTTGIALSKTF